MWYSFSLFFFVLLFMYACNLGTTGVGFYGAFFSLFDCLLWVESCGWKFVHYQNAYSYVSSSSRNRSFSLAYYARE